MNSFFFFLSLLSSIFLCAFQSEESMLYQYLYPCGSYMVNGTQESLVLWQKDAQTTELYRWNPVTHEVHKELHSAHVPCGIRMLPSGAGYSFIEDGRVRIKYFIKRSAKAIDFALPIYNISVVNWLTDECGYCSAQEGARFGIYVFTQEGQVDRLLADRSIDFLSPSLVNNTLYCIARRVASSDQQVQHAIISCVIDPRTGRACRGQTLFEMGSLAGAFLRMESDTKGFVVGYDPRQQIDGQVVRMHYCCIESIDNSWHANYLFTLLLPSYLLNTQHPNRLCESILPLLPAHHKDSIYYSSLGSVGGSCMQVYCYSRGKISKCHTSGGNRPSLLFGIQVMNNSVLCGGILVPDIGGFMPSLEDADGRELSIKLCHIT